MIIIMLVITYITQLLYINLLYYNTVGKLTSRPGTYMEKS